MTEKKTNSESSENVDYSAKIIMLEKELDDCNKERDWYKKKYYDQESQLFRCRTAIRSLIESMSILKEYV